MPAAPARSLPLPVAIVGAGPVGLSLALGLARVGVRSVVFERKSGTSKRSKAPGIHVRTREVFRHWGVEERFLNEGVLVRHARLHEVGDSGRTLFSLDFSELDDEAERAGLLILEQGRTEALLLDAVRASGSCDVRFGAEVVGLHQREDRVTLTAREQGIDRDWDASFVAGCDGAGSFVRDALGLPFEGFTYAVCPALADVRVPDDRDGLPWPRVTHWLTRVIVQAPPIARGIAFALARAAVRVPRVRVRVLRRLAMLDLEYPASPLLDRRERAAGARVPNVPLRAPDGGTVRLYDLLPVAPVILDVAESREFSRGLPVEHVIRVGRGGHEDATGALRGMLGDADGWILVRPDARVAWARHARDDMAEAVARALGRHP